MGAHLHGECSTAVRSLNLMTDTCKYGHPRSDSVERTYVRNSRSFTKLCCLACKREWNRKYQYPARKMEDISFKRSVATPAVEPVLDCILANGARYRIFPRMGQECN